jgi:hypothetical protein
MQQVRTKLFVMIIAIACLVATPVQEAKAQIPIAEIIKEAVKKVIKAFDLMIQRLQTKTIWLQNAQKVLENKLSELKLTEIAQWTEKHRKLYETYYEELWQIKNALSSYLRIKQTMEQQQRVLKEYNRAWNMVKQDGNFTQQEIDYMYRVYKGILAQSMRNIDQLVIVINSYKTKMTDAQRLSIIMQTGSQVEQNLMDLLEFNMHAFQLSISRAKTKSEVDRLRRLYGFQNN